MFTFQHWLNLYKYKHNAVAAVVDEIIFYSNYITRDIQQTVLTIPSSWNCSHCNTQPYQLAGHLDQWTGLE